MFLLLTPWFPLSLLWREMTGYSLLLSGAVESGLLNLVLLSLVLQESRLTFY